MMSCFREHLRYNRTENWFNVSDKNRCIAADHSFRFSLLINKGHRNRRQYNSDCCPLAFTAVYRYLPTMSRKYSIYYAHSKACAFSPSCGEEWVKEASLCVLAHTNTIV